MRSDRQIPHSVKSQGSARLLLVLRSKLLADLLPAALSKVGLCATLVLESVVESLALPPGPGQPDIAVIDATVATDALELIGRVRAAAPTAPVLLMNAPAEHEFLWSALRRGAAGCLTWDTPVEQLQQAILAVSSGQPFFSPSRARLIQTQRATAELRLGIVRLSRREQQIADLLDQGVRTKEIAAQLGVSVRTVEKHCQHINSKWPQRLRPQQGSPLDSYA
jgi:DNA-binding NarL/FixJ family response regulator